MSGHKYISDSKNLFVEDDIDDETFLKNSRRTVINYEQPSAMNNPEMQRQTYMDRKQAIEDRTLQSTERSISILRDSEQIGIATAEELMRQREQLEKTDKRLDEINATLRFSQKHINGIKSVFGSLKNYLSGKNDQQLPRSTVGNTSMEKGPDLQSQVPPGYDSFSSHPTTRLRDLDQNAHPQSSSGSKNFSQMLDANLDEMYGSISRLKGLAEGLQTEIETQNDLIDNITTKTETADVSIGRQNKEMNRILKK